MNRTILTIILALAATMAQAVTKLGSTTTNTIVAESSDIDVLSNQNAAAFSGILNLSNSIPVVPSTFTDTTARASAATAQGGVASLSNTVADLPTFQSITNALYGTQIYSMTTDVVVTSTGGDDYNGPPLGTIFTDPEYSAMWTYATTNSYYVLADPLDPTNLYACDTWIVTKGVGQPTWAAMGTLPLTITNVSAGATGTLTITFRQLLIGTTNAFQAAESDTNALTQLWGETNRAIQADAGFQATLDRYDSETNEIWQGTYGWIGVSGTVVRTVTDWNAASGTVYAGAALGASSLQPNAVDGTDPLGNVFANGQLTTLGSDTPWTGMGYYIGDGSAFEPAGTLTTWLAGVPNISTFNNDSAFIDASGVPAAETDPVVGAITGIVKADGAGTISAADGADIAALEGDPLSWHTTAVSIVYSPIDGAVPTVGDYSFAIIDAGTIGTRSLAIGTISGAYPTVGDDALMVGWGHIGHSGGSIGWGNNGGDRSFLFGPGLTGLDDCVLIGTNITSGAHNKVFVWNPYGRDELGYMAAPEAEGSATFFAPGGMRLKFDGQYYGGVAGLTGTLSSAVYFIPQTSTNGLPPGALWNSNGIPVIYIPE